MQNKRAESLIADHPVLPLALRAAFAAITAWLVVIPLGGVADDYPYYAPLGAVVGVSATVTGSLRAAAQTFGSLGLGTLLGLALWFADLPTAVGIGLVVGLGTIVGAWHRLGAFGSWVPISALFVLIIGGDEPWHFGLGYLGLTTLGALVGGAICLALPPLRLAEAARAQESLRRALMTQLQVLADGLDRERPPTGEQWAQHRPDLDTPSLRVRELIGRALEGPPVNWRARRWQRRADELSAQGRALASLALHISDLGEFIAGEERAERAERGAVPLGPDLRPVAALALRATAAALDSVEGGVGSAHAVAEALRSVHRLADAVREVRERTDDDMFAAGALVSGLRRVLLTVAPTPPPGDGSR